MATTNGNEPATTTTNGYKLATTTPNSYKFVTTTASFEFKTATKLTKQKPELQDVGKITRSFVFKAPLNTQYNNGNNSKSFSLRKLLASKV